MKIFVVIILYCLVVSNQATASWQKEVARISVDKIIEHPEKFHGKEVCVTGTVSSKASIMGYGGFLLKGDAHELLVVTSNNPPIVGSVSTFCGNFKQAISINTWSMNMLIYDE